MYMGGVYVSTIHRRHLSRFQYVSLLNVFLNSCDWLSPFEWVSALLTGTPHLRSSSSRPAMRGLMLCWPLTGSPMRWPSQVGGSELLHSIHWYGERMSLSRQWKTKAKQKLLQWGGNTDHCASCKIWIQEWKISTRDALILGLSTLLVLEKYVPRKKKSVISYCVIVDDFNTRQQCW